MLTGRIRERGPANGDTHRDDEDGAEAAAPPGPLEQVPRGVPRRAPQPRGRLAGRRLEPPEQRLVPAGAGSRGGPDPVDEAADHPGERVLLLAAGEDVHGPGAGGGGRPAVGGGLGGRVVHIHWWGRWGAVVRGSQCNWPARRRRGEETKSGLGEVTRCAGCKCSTGFEGHVAGGVGQASPRRLSLWALLSLHHALMTFSINWV